jgi:hypothetical protein
VSGCSSIFIFSAVNTGQPFIVRDAPGTVILHDRGVMKGLILFDTTGDHRPPPVPDPRSRLERPARSGRPGRNVHASAASFR